VSRFIKKRIGELLLDQGILTQEQLDKALATQKQTGRRLGEVLLDLNFVAEHDIVMVVSIQYGCPYLPLDRYRIEAGMKGLLSEEAARKYQVVPVDRIGSILTVAMADPLDHEAVAAAKEESGLEIQAFVASRTEVLNAIARLYRREG